MPRYDAFISYSHAADGALAPAVQRGLQRLARPWNRRRALTVFRDQTGLAVTPHLWGSITDALDTAGWFVLLASPESAASTWVGKEIEHWLAKPGARERILPVVTGGVWDWSDAGGFTAESNAVHPALREAFDEEPLYLDLTWARTKAQLDLGDPRFREAIASLAAPIHGRPKDDLVGEDIRQYKLARRLRRAALAGLTVLTVAAVVASVVAIGQQRRAERNAAQSRARELAATARETMDDDPGLASLLALEANYPNGAGSPVDVPEARVALGLALRNRQWAAYARVGPRVEAPATNFVAAGPRRIATVDLDRCSCAVRWWDPTTGKQLPAPASPTEAELVAPYGTVRASVSTAATTPPRLGATPVTDPFTTDPTRDLLVGRDVGGPDLLVQRTSGGPVLARLELPAGEEAAFVVAQRSGRVVALTRTGRLLQWSVETGGAAEPVPYRPPDGNTVRSIADLGDDRILVDSAAGAPPVTPCSRRCIDDVIVTSDTGSFNYVGTTITTPHLDVVDLTAPSELTAARSVGGADVTVAGSYAVAPRAAGGHRYVAARSIERDALRDADVLVWDVAAGRAVARIPQVQPTDLRWVDATTLAVASARGVEMFRPLLPPFDETATTALAVSTDGRTTAMLPATPGATAVRYRTPRADAGATAGDRRADPVAGVEPGRLAVSPDGRRVAEVVDRPGTCIDLGGVFCPTARAVRIRDLAGGPVRRTLDGATAAAFAPSGSRIAVGRPGRVSVEGGAGGSRRVPIGDGMPTSVTWTPDGTALVVVVLDGEAQSRVVLVDLATGRGRPLTSPGDGVVAAVSADGRLLATSGRGGRVTLWSRSGTGRAPVRRSTVVADPAPPTGLAFSHDGTRLVTSGESTSVIWDVSRPQRPRRLDVLTDLPAIARVVEPGTAPPLTAGTPAPPTPWGLAAFDASDRYLLLAGPSGVVRLADFDPGLACALAGPADLAAARAVLGAPSACTRVPALRRHLRADATQG